MSSKSYLPITGHSLIRLLTMCICFAIFAVVIYSLIFPGRSEISIDYANYPLLAAQIKNATKVVLYEGLPHQYFEPELLTKELRDKKTITLQHFPFYRETISVSNEDAKLLTSLFCDGKTLIPDQDYVVHGQKTINLDRGISSGRFCGGFHPDYCIEWQVNGSVYQMQVCLGCCLVVCYGPGSTLRCDIDNSEEAPLVRVLKKYRKNRPERKN